MHRLTSSFVLGYHGCDRDVGERLLSGSTFFQRSENDYDWLGPGVYFWEANPLRGLQFASEAMRRSGSKIREPFVIGAIIELGYCLDLTTTAGLDAVRSAHQALIDLHAVPPKNSVDQLRRNLDCAAIVMLHSMLRAKEDPELDTVKGVFTEGEPLYEGSGFREKTHIQIAVCNLKCIKGVFRVPQSELA